MNEVSTAEAPAPAILPASPASEPNTALVTLNALVPEKVFAPGGIEALLAKLETEVLAQAKTLDISTEKGRKAIASLGYKVAQSKTAIDTMGKALTEGWQKQTNLVNADRRVLRERLDALKDAVRAPLDAYLEADKRRIAAHEAALAEITALAITDGLTAKQIGERIWSVPAHDDRAWQEFSARAAATIDATCEQLEAARSAAAAREAAEATAAAERAAEERRIAAENEAKRIERERQIAANARALAIMQAEAAAEEAAQANRAAVAAAEERAAKAEAVQIAAAERAEREKTAAVEAERMRAHYAKITESAEAARRAANVAHRKSVHQEALGSLLALANAELTEDQGKLIIAALARGEIKHCNIVY